MIQKPTTTDPALDEIHRPGCINVHTVKIRLWLTYVATLVLSLAALQPAKAELPNDLLGIWMYESHKSAATPPPPTETGLHALEVTKDFLIYPHPSGAQHKIEYELFRDGDEWIIDMYPQYGLNEGHIFPSRISLVDDKLRIMMPLNSRASQRRPKALQAEGNPDWVVFVFRHDVSAR